MANSDKNADRSHTSGNPPQPAEPVSQTQGSTEALKSMISQGLQQSGDRLSLETRLGMVTIVILVFTFGFLVYRKVDLHHQQLTQASIGPQAEETNSPPAPASSVAAETVDSARVMDAVQEFSDHSPVLATDAAFDDPFTERADLSLSEPVVHQNALIAEPTILPDSSVNADTDSELIVGSRRNPANSEFPAIESATSDSIAAFDFGDTAAPQNSVPELTLNDPLVEFSAPASPTTDFPVADNAEPLTTIVDSPSNFPEQVDQEPMLIAMAEPPVRQDPFSEQVPTFDAGFTETQSTQSGTTAPNDPVEIQLPSAESFPDLKPVEETVALFPELNQNLTAGDPVPRIENSSPFDTTLPAATADAELSLPKESTVALRSTPIHRVAPAIARGSDGKFSLAAFNYQNNADPPVDDGNTYEVIVVQPGDNYSTISRRVYGTTRYFSALAVFNQHRIPDPRRMRPGMKILIPSTEILEQRYPLLFPELQNSEVQPAGFFLLEDGSPAFRIGGRETLSEISERFLGRSARWTEIYQLNRSVLKDPNKLRPGLVLALPADAVEVNVAP